MRRPAIVWLVLVAVVCSYSILLAAQDEIDLDPSGNYTGYIVDAGGTPTVAGPEPLSLILDNLVGDDPGSVGRALCYEKSANNWKPTKKVTYNVAHTQQDLQSGNFIVVTIEQVRETYYEGSTVKYRPLLRFFAGGNQFQQSCIHDSDCQYSGIPAEFFGYIQQYSFRVWDNTNSRYFAASTGKKIRFHVLPTTAQVPACS